MVKGPVQIKTTSTMPSPLKPKLSNTFTEHIQFLDQRLVEDDSIKFVRTFTL